jgi:hypothetical protein
MSFRPKKTGTSLPVPAIRYSTLQLLRAYIKSYLDSLISLCIAIATAEHQAKQRSKVWRGEPNTVSLFPYKNLVGELIAVFLLD